jgi:exodeoxyribonuclease V alpha subunit
MNICKVLPMSKVMKTLKHAGFSELACQFASYIERMDNSEDELVPLTAGLLSEAVAQGHVCLNLLRMDALYEKVMGFIPEHLDEWLTRLQRSNVVGKDGDYRPLILNDDGLLYLYRHWQDEKTVAHAIQRRCQTIALQDEQQLKHDFEQWPSTVSGTDWQKVAVLMTLTRNFSVISGGPGTGKTTIVLRILQSLKNQQASCRIALAAPTGKAAARLQQATENKDDSVEAKTLHRLLGITANNEQGRYNSDRPLPFDVVIVDEASMIDISLMAKLLAAMSLRTRLILLGDSQQLASVESGAVLANLCRDQMMFDADFVAMAASVAGVNLDETVISSSQSVLINSVVQLQHSYRFDQHSLIGRLAKSIQSGDKTAVVGELTQADSLVWQQPSVENVLKAVVDGYHNYFEAIASSSDPQTCIQAFEQFRVLCALKLGPQSVASVNASIEKHLNRKGWRSHNDFYHGRPIMVVQNDYRQQLFNGDIGLVLRDEKGDLQVYFLFDNTMIIVPITRLPAHETAFAMTVHKSQGSEFNNVCVVLPEEDSAVLTRELLYTAISRAKEQVIVMANEDIVYSTVVKMHQRETGLAERLS